MRIDVVSIFPAYLAPLRLSLVGRAITVGILDLRVHDLRDYTHDRHRTVDDAPYGGGPGMVMKPEPWGECLDEVLGTDPGDAVLLVPTPAGTPFRQDTAQELSRRNRLVLACGRYEGIDQRVAEHYRKRVDVREVSIGDYVLAGGEAAALVMIEAIARLLPGVLGNEGSAGRRLLRRGPGRTARSAGVHAAPGLAQPAGAGRPAVRRPRRRRALAQRAVPAAHRDRSVPTCCRRRDAGIGRSRPACGTLKPRRGSACRREPRDGAAPHELITGERRTTAGDLWRLRNGHPMHTLDSVNATSLRSDIPDFRPGDTVKVHVKVIEGSRSRIQMFQGAVIARQGGGIGETFTVRKVSFGVGVERTFPVHTPSVDKIEVVTRGDVRRAKLYYLRERRGKAAKIRERRHNAG